MNYKKKETFISISIREICRENKSSQIDHLMCSQVTLCTLEFQLEVAARLFCAVRLFDIFQKLWRVIELRAIYMKQVVSRTFLPVAK